MPTANDRAQINFIIKDLEETAEKIIQDFVISLTEALIEATPVRSGWAQANWRITTDKPPASTARRPRGRARSGEVAAVRAEQRQDIANVRNFRLDDKRITIYNNVPYITLLDRGHSNQAPTMFVLRTIQKEVDKVRRLGNVS